MDTKVVKPLNIKRCNQLQSGPKSTPTSFCHTFITHWRIAV